MATLDLRRVGKLFIYVLENKSWNFELAAQAGAPVLTGAAATMIITKGFYIQTLGIGTGLTITAANKIAVSPAPLEQGIYNYTIEIIAATGEIIRIIDQIQCTNNG